MNPLTGALLAAASFLAMEEFYPISPGLIPGVTAYGATYLLVHDVAIHGRLPLRFPRLAYLRWVHDAHELHHRFGGEPYGMLLPVVPRALRERAARTREARIRL